MAGDCLRAVTYGTTNIQAIVKLAVCTVILLAGLVAVREITGHLFRHAAFTRHAVGGLSVILYLVLAGYFLRFYLDCVISSLTGSDEAPDVPTFDLRELLRTAVRAAGVVGAWCLPVVTIPLLPLGILALSFTSGAGALNPLPAVRAAAKRPAALAVLWGVLLIWGAALVVATWGIWLLIAALAAVAERQAAWFTGAVLATVIRFVGAFVLSVVFHMFAAVLFRCIGIFGRHHPGMMAILTGAAGAAPRPVRTGPELVNELTGKILSGGAAMVGFADLRDLPAEAREHLPFGVSFAVPLRAGVVAGIVGGPTEAYRREYRRVNAIIDELAAGAAELLRTCGHHAAARTATVDKIDPEMKPVELPHKTVAMRAGLGWIGTSALLVTERYGSAVRLGTVLTDAPLPLAEPLTASRCGDCTACVEVCPAGALTGRQWEPGLGVEDMVYTRACREVLRKNWQRLGADICGMCIAACPWTKRYLQGGGRA